MASPLELWALSSLNWICDLYDLGSAEHLFELFKLLLQLNFLQIICLFSQLTHPKGWILHEDLVTLCTVSRWFLIVKCCEPLVVELVDNARHHYELDSLSHVALTEETVYLVLPLLSNLLSSLHGVVSSRHALHRVGKLSKGA